MLIIVLTQAPDTRHAPPLIAIGLLKATSSLLVYLYNKIANIHDSLVAPFTLGFISYARTKDPSLGLVYVYGDQGKTIIENHLSGSQTVIYNSSEPGSSGTLFNSDTDAINELGLKIGGENFIHDVPVKLSSFSTSYYKRRS